MWRLGALVVEDLVPEESRACSRQCAAATADRLEGHVLTRPFAADTRPPHACQGTVAGEGEIALNHVQAVHVPSLFGRGTYSPSGGLRASGVDLLARLAVAQDDG